MLFEDFDKRIREAADQHHPAYDEKAWQKMEKLLNQHLPQQKDDSRRILLLLLLLFLIGGGAYFVFSNSGTKGPDSQKLVQQSKNGVGPDKSGQLNTDNTGVSQTQPNKSVQSVKGGIKSSGTEITNTSLTHDESVITGNTKKVLTPHSNSEEKQVNNRDDVFNSTAKFTDKNSSTTILTKQDDQRLIAENSRNETVPTGKPMTGNKTANNPTIDNTLARKAELKTNSNEQVSTTDAQKPSQAKKLISDNNGFSFSVSAGPDVSKAGSSKTGKTTLAYGLGIGYTRNRFTLRTGIYNARKIYWAGPNDYKLSYISPGPSKFEGADANCNVVEIPVKLSYAFSETPKGNWFASAGLSSYLMKKEKYLYYYKISTATFNYAYQVENKNKHYFSVLTLSGGYSHKISKTVSITAEPYAEIPLTGIGVGHVRLNSGGVLFTLGVKPFKK